MLPGRLSNFVCDRPLDSTDDNQDYDWSKVVESRQQLMLEQGIWLPGFLASWLPGFLASWLTDQSSYILVTEQQEAD